MDIVVGSRVKYLSYVRPNNELTGTVKEILPDNRKKAKYLIAPDEDNVVNRKIKNVKIYRYHPYETPNKQGVIEYQIEDIQAVIEDNF